MSDFNATYPEYAATVRLDTLRKTEYSYLDEGGHVYLDYTGAGLAAQSQLLAHTARLQAGCYGNPHSDNPTSSASTRLVEQAREAVLRFFSTTAELADVDAFLDFAERSYRDRWPDLAGLAARHAC